MIKVNWKKSYVCRGTCGEVVLLITIIRSLLNFWVIFKHIGQYSCLLCFKVKYKRAQKLIDLLITFAPITILSRILAISNIDFRILKLLHPDVVHQSDIVLIFETKRLCTPHLSGFS